ncbi:unnamed protein product [Prorocentrum cordatum]|uniref:Uncharacterized protein n=1 Tax=Prorocentrum cordatum TaxID=2364126 RepID=A0ABN9YET9_9DINO|nr:unnamed protein product [Polarella glacialis]
MSRYRGVVATGGQQDFVAGGEVGGEEAEEEEENKKTGAEAAAGAGHQATHRPSAYCRPGGLQPFPSQGPRATTAVFAFLFMKRASSKGQLWAARVRGAEACSTPVAHRSHAV